MERVLYDFVVAAVLVLRRERPLPRLALLQTRGREMISTPTFCSVTAPASACCTR
jgi:hypothetical protein